MKIKTKLILAVGTLFLMVFMLAALSGWYIHQLRKDTSGILAANYNSLLYSRNMLQALDELQQDPRAWTRFEESLAKQQRNITETGEKEITEDIDAHLDRLRNNPDDEMMKSAIRKAVDDLMRLNMEAIALKSGVADQTANDAIIILSLVGSLCFVIAFTLLVNLPAHVANPIGKLNESIKQIAAANYRARVHFDGRDEFSELAQSFNKMAEKLEEYSESQLDDVLQAKKRIETLVENMRDPVIGVDEHRQVIFINEEALKVTALHIDQILHKNIADVALQHDLLRDVFNDIASPAAGQQFEGILKIYAHKKQSYFAKDVIDINVVPTGEQESKYIGQVIMLKNITPFKELDLAKNNFIGTVSHEFKTPIAAIQMSVQLLRNHRIGVMNGEQKQLLEGIKEDADRLLAITKELLTMTQVESGAIQLNVHEADVKPMLDYAVKANRVAAEYKQVSVQVSLDDEVGRVWADNEKTAWVLTNFVSNAIRYSHEHTTVQICVQKEGDRIRFSVFDKGQGIEAKYIDRIFERYFRVPGARSGGTGLGLSISKEFIEAQGGEIAVESEFGSGSCFFFYLKSA